MKIIKSDKRYQMYNKGLTIILEFGWTGSENKKYFAFKDMLIDMYGFERELCGTMWVTNKDWRSIVSRSKRRRRLFIRDEAALSYLLLKDSVNT